MVAFQRALNLLFIFVIFAVLLSASLYQFTRYVPPCPLCILQKLGMIGIAASLLMNCKFGIKAQHYGLAILSALIGRIFSLKQISMHVCPEFPTYGRAVFGFDLYVWAFIVFTCSIFACALLTIFFGYTKKRDFSPSWGFLDRIAFWAVFLITLCNLITTFMRCGLGTC